MGHRIAKFIQRLSGTKPCPEIHWSDVVRIEAMGTDAFSAFQIWLTFTHSDGTEAQVFSETRGYWDIVDSLHTRFPSISPTWYDEMAEQPWQVERVLYSRDAANAGGRCQFHFRGSRRCSGVAELGSFGDMRALRQFGVGVAVLAGLYVLLPLVVFDFTSTAVPHDEENFGTQAVAIGPKPRWWIPKAAYDYDVPGGFGYDPGGWPFVVWKPMCVAFVKLKGYALPAEWR